MDGGNAAKRANSAEHDMQRFAFLKLLPAVFIRKKACQGDSQSDVKHHYRRSRVDEPILKPWHLAAEEGGCASEADSKEQVKDQG